MSAPDPRSIALLVFAGALVSSPLAAQNRDRPADPAQSLPVQPRCGAQVRPLAASGEALPDAAAQPQLVPTDRGVLLVWRTQRASLMLTTLNASMERATDDRELARPAGVFAATAAPGGAAIVMVERQRHGEDALLLARVATDGEARNVPRELVRANGIDGVSIAWTGTGYVIAWSVAGEARGTFVVEADPRGVPVGSSHRALDASGPRLATLAGSSDVVLVSTAGADPAGTVLDGEGNATDGTSWPATARRIAAGPTGYGVFSVALPIGPDGAIAPVAVRWSPGSPPTQSDAPIRLAAGTTVVDVVGDRGGILATFDEPSGRELIARIAPDGAAGILATRMGSLGVIEPASDGTIWVLGHEPAPPGQAHLAMVQVVCPRAAPPTPPSGPTSAESTNNDSATRHAPAM